MKFFEARLRRKCEVVSLGAQSLGSLKFICSVGEIYMYALLNIFYFVHDARRSGHIVHRRLQ